MNMNNLADRRSSRQMQFKFNFSLRLCALVCTICLLHQLAQQAQASHRRYDPEQQDGIPVFSARSISKPLDDWETSSDPATTPPHNQAQFAQRRQADSEMEDGMDDEDEDEYKSGSSPQESVENPSYGESRRAARDGDDIEEFFDKHLGPPQEATAADESSESAVRQDVPAIDPDTDDHYEAAASSPLSNIFHSLLSHSHSDHKHKRPFLQIATSSSEPDSGASSDKESSSSSKTPGGSSMMKASQSAQSFVEAAPIALAFTPMAMSSQLIGQDSNGAEQQDQREPGTASPSPGVREIYIGRRPTVMSYLQQAHIPQNVAQPQPGYTTAGSSNVWRGAPGRQVVYEQDQSNNHARYPIAASYAYQREQPTVAASVAASSGGAADDDDQTVTYGLSFGGASSADDGSSGGSADSTQDDQTGGAVETNEPQQVDQSQAYMPYNTRYSASSSLAHNNYYQNGGGPYFRQGYVRPVQQQHQMMVQQPAYSQYARGGSTRYHRDPSESINDAATAMGSSMPQQKQQQQQQQYHTGYQQLTAAHYRGSNGNNQLVSDDEADETRNRAGARQLADRQHLLAALNREIKASPQYRNNNAAAASSTAQTRLYANRGNGGQRDNRQHLVAIKTVKKTYKGGDLDSYNSFHSEVDPYKTFTSTSRMINDPTDSLVAARSQVPAQSGSGRLTATDSGPHVSSDASDISNTSIVADQHTRFNTNLLTGPLTNFDQSTRESHLGQQQGDLLRNKNPNGNTETDTIDQSQSVANTRVRREDPDEREIDNDVDDDGVWVDDDEDDDNRQQSSDVNETAQDPESENKGEEGDEEEDDDNGQQDAANNVPIAHHQMNPPGVIGGPHGYELSPNDLMIYHG